MYVQWGNLVYSAQVEEGSLILDKIVARNSSWKLKVEELKIKVRSFLLPIYLFS